MCKDVNEKSIVFSTNGHFIKKKGQFSRGYNIKFHGSNNRASEYMKQKQVRPERYKYKIITEDFSTPLSISDRQKIRKVLENLNKLSTNLT